MTEHDSPDSTNPSEIEALIARLEDGQLGEADRRLISRLLRLLLTLIRVVEQKNTSISRLKRLLFGPGTDKRTVATPATASNTSSNAAPSTVDEPSKSATPEARPTEESTRRRGHGRQSAADYTGARRVVCLNPELVPGDGCPSLKCRGHLYDTREPSIFIRLEGHPVITATRYEQQVLRCSTCAERFTARASGGCASREVRGFGGCCHRALQVRIGNAVLPAGTIAGDVWRAALGVGAIRALRFGRRMRSPGL